MMDLEQAKLIEWIQQFPQLWDKKNELFEDKLAVENAWGTLCSIMERPVDDLKIIWQQIRTSYVKERNIIKNLPTGTGQYSSKWPYYDLCLFLDKAIATRKTKSNYIGKIKCNMPTKTVWQEKITEECVETDVTDVTQETDDYIMENFNLASPRPGPSNAGTNSSTPTGRPSPSAKEVKKNVSTSLESLITSCSALGDEISTLVEKENIQENTSWCINSKKFRQG